MKRLIRFIFLSFVLAGSVSLAGCSPEVGSEAWCQDLKETPKVDWSTRDATAYAEHCIFRRPSSR